jgi:hypothetical protein
MAMLYIITAVALVLGFASLAVDYGRVQLTRTQLRVAADAAARAAASNFDYGTTTARSVAVATAQANSADGTAVALNQSQDVQFGTWDTTLRTFTTLTGSAESSANAIRVRALRTAVRGNAVRLTFAPLIGRSTCDVTAESIVSLEAVGPGIVGLDYITMSDKKTNSYKSRINTAPATFDNRGNIFSNGDINLSKGVVINGDARPGIGCMVKRDSTVTITGSTSPLAFTLYFPMPDGSPYVTNNNNSHFGNSIKNGNLNIVSGTVTVAGGNYYIGNMNISSQGRLVFQGPATLWVTGAITCSGGIATSGNVPSNFKIRMISGGNKNTASFTGNSVIYCDYYGPKSALTISGNADYWGRLIAQSLDVSGSGDLHYDESTVSTGGGVAMLK